MENEEEDQEKIYEKAKDSDFKQQSLPAWRPVPTIGSVLTIFITFGVIFIILGIIMAVFSNKIVEVSKRYDNICAINDLTSCIVELEITKDMEPNIYVYYQLKGFYQNHRRYVKSKSVSQLEGKDITLEKMKDDGDCDPVVTNDEMDKKTGAKGNSLNGGDLAIPCGLIAKTYFTDKFSNFKILDKDKNELKSADFNDKNIAFEKDKKLYKNVDLQRQWIDITDEHFLVWMRPSGLPNPRKLYGKIKEKLSKGTYIRIEITNTYDVSSFNGEKLIILSTTNAFGGKNKFLSICYIIAGALSIITAVVFIIGYKFKKKQHCE